MIDYALIILQALQLQAPPGASKFSVTPEICHADYCEGTRWSSFFDAYVHAETAEEGTARYTIITQSMVRAAELETCKSLQEGVDQVDDCTPYPAAKGWSMLDLLESTIGVMIPESGVREDVMNGRGSHKHPDDVGGEGRGPAGEACLMQIIPSSIGAFAPAGWSTAPSDLLGGDPEHLVACFRTGMRMLMKSMAHCNWATREQFARITKGGQTAPYYDKHFGMYSLYGTGNSCWSSNGSKTSYRTAVYYKVSSTVRQLVEKQKKAQMAVTDGKQRQTLAAKESIQ
jgi:hypothetical protein